MRLRNPFGRLGLTLPRLEDLPCDFADRIRTTQALLTTCSETRSVVLKFYLDSVPSPTGELRFHGGKDVISILNTYDIRHLWRTCGRWELSGDWNLKIQRLALPAYEKRPTKLLLLRPSWGPDWLEVPAHIQNLLVRFPKLQKCFLRNQYTIEFTGSSFNKLIKKYPLLIEALGKVFPSGLSYSHLIKSGSYRLESSEWQTDPTEIMRGISCISQSVVDVLDDGHQNVRHPSLWDRIQQGHLEILPMCDVDREVEDSASSLSSSRLLMLSWKQNLEGAGDS